MRDEPSWEIRPYERGDESMLVVLFARAFGRSITEAHWRWKLTGHAFPAPNVFVAVVSGRAVAQYAAIPVRYVGPDGQVIGLVAVDALTDPDFRRRGVMTDVCRHAHDVWRRAGAAFIVGLPNQQWGSRTEALGWREVCSLRWRVRPVHAGRIVGRRFGPMAAAAAAPVASMWDQYWRRKRITRTPTVEIRRADSAAPFGRLWSTLVPSRAPRRGYTIVRDAAWIDWRYLKAPDATYAVWLAEREGRPLGHAVTRLLKIDDRHVGYVAELTAVGDDPAVLSQLLTASLSHLEAEDVELVASLAVPGTAADAAMTRTGFLFSWGRFSVRTIPLQSETSPALFNTFGGDFDVV